METITHKIIYVLPNGNEVETAYSISDLISATLTNALIRINGKEYQVIKKVKDISTPDFAYYIYLSMPML